MGIPSVGILLHEVIKLMYHARVKDPVFFRLGTCGGIGLDGGQLVITDEAVDGMMRPYLELVNFNLTFKEFNRKLHSYSNYLLQPVLGQLVQRPSKLDTDLAKELKSLSTQGDPYETHVGRTMCTYDFYEGIQIVLFSIAYSKLSTYPITYVCRSGASRWSILRLH